MSRVIEMQIKINLEAEKLSWIPDSDHIDLLFSHNNSQDLYISRAKLSDKHLQYLQEILDYVIENQSIRKL